MTTTTANVRLVCLEQFLENLTKMCQLSDMRFDLRVPIQPVSENMTRTGEQFENLSILICLMAFL